MESTAGRQSIDIAAEPSRPTLALGLAVLSVPGSLFTWDVLPGGGLVFGAPLAVAALILGLQVRRRSQAGRGKALVAILLAGAMLTLMGACAVAQVL